MNSNEKERIIELCLNFRQAIELCKNKMGDLFWFEWFPKGCCREASTMLAKYLSDKGFDRIYCVRGEDKVYGNQYSHVWLELDKWVIDITPDQFGEKFGKVMVTQSSELHRNFKVVEREPYLNFWNGTGFNDGDMRRKYPMIYEKAEELLYL
ncbi:hypothetical protein [Anaerotignum sp.]